jgi:hypothetical protein
VSARTTSADEKLSAIAATTPESTRPSNGQPNATLTVIVTGSAERSIMRSAVARASSTDWFALRLLKLSVAANVKLTRSRPDAARRS